MNNDSQLQRDVSDELAWEPAIDHAHIGVAVANGVVTLSGFVKSYPEKIAAEHAARRVFGVRGIAEEIKVRFDFTPTTDDAQIAEKILTLFNHDITVPENHLQVQVEKGWVKLTGKVDWNYQREMAKRIAGHVLGVIGVTNLIEVRHVPTPRDVKDRIMAAFKRSADIEASAISVTAEGGIVHLSGQVPSWKDRRTAELAAWSAPGVTKVEDTLTIA
ncbi:BON domain-containing protein [Sphingomonas oryzagri]